VKKPSKILVSIAVIMIAALLAAGGGITYILYTCQMCDISTATTLSVLNPAVEEDTCCGGGTEDQKGNDKNLSSACCDYTVGQLTIDNFVFSTNIIPDAIQVQPFTSNSEIIIYECEQVSGPVFIRNKHGGRFIVNANCQLLS
jgi:hypothetical protein